MPLSSVLMQAHNQACSIAPSVLLALEFLARRIVMPAISTKSVADKLMIKPGKSVLFLNTPPHYEKTLGSIAANANILPGDATAADIIQVFVASSAELKKQLPRLKKCLKPEGALWVTYHKGTSKTKSDINRDIIAEYASSIGLEGVAIISVDDDWSALRLKLVS
jgi:hypothetical protein